MAKRPSKRPPARRVSRKSPAKAVKKTDKRGTPKGKGTQTGGPGFKRSGPKPKGRIGNPPFVPTAEQRIQVETFVAAGAQQWLIEEYLGVSHMTLLRHFKVELDHGKARVDAKVGSSIARKALDGDPDFMKFYAARRAGWKSTTAVENSGPDGGPIRHQISPEFDLAKLNRDDLKELKRLREKASADESPAA